MATIGLPRDSAEVPDLVPWPRARFAWHESAPAALQDFDLRDTEGWNAWAKHLLRRRWPRGLDRLLPGKRSPLAWNMPDAAAGDTVQLTEQLYRVTRGKRPRANIADELDTWLARGGRGATADDAVEILAWLHAVPALAEHVAPGAWRETLEQMLSLAEESGGLAMNDDPLLHQLLAGELSLTLGYLFPELQACRDLWPAGGMAVHQGLARLLDGRGLPHARHLPSLRPLLACWTRCRALLTRRKDDSWSEEAQEQYEWLLRQSLRLTRPDGSQLLSGGEPTAWRSELWETARAGCRGKKDRRLAALLVPDMKPRKAERPSAARLPSPSVHSEWAELGVLRRAWSDSAEVLAVSYHDRSIRAELRAGPDRLWHGDWPLQVSLDGTSLEPIGPWEEVCWVSDEDGDYLELEIELTEGVRVQRQLYLAREDHFLLAADAVLGARPGRIEYQSVLPLPADVSFAPAEQTSEGHLQGPSRSALVLPLGLPEWRRGARLDTLIRTEAGLALRQARHGSQLFAPLFVDLDPGRLNRVLTWRRLTVTENRALVSDDTAVGFRVQIGGRQWVIYRSLAAKVNRSVLGVNLSTEFLIGRFPPSGVVEPLLEVE